jgi:hypothetical protein
MLAMRWSKRIVALAVLLTAAGVFAQGAPDEATVPGELHVKMNSEYAKLSVDGDEWSQHEFSGDGKTIYIKELDRAKDHTVLLTPSLGGLKPVEIVVGPKDYKKKRMKDKTFHFIATKSVKFEKAETPAPAPEPAPDPETGSEPEE